jgi:hypothetical protein
LTKSSHFSILPNGDWPSPLVLSSGAFYITTGLNFITSNRILSATFQFLSISAKLSSESNPTGIFSASSSASNHSPHQRTFPLRGAPASTAIAGRRQISHIQIPLQPSRVEESLVLYREPRSPTPSKIKQTACDEARMES